MHKSQAVQEERAIILWPNIFSNTVGKPVLLLLALN